MFYSRNRIEMLLSRMEGTVPEVLDTDNKSTNNQNIKPNKQNKHHIPTNNQYKQINIITNKDTCNHDAPTPIERNTNNKSHRQPKHQIKQTNKQANK